MSTMTLQLNDRLKSFCESQAAQGGFGSAGAYVEALLSREERKVADIRELEAELRQGLSSGSEIEVNEHFWENKRAELLAKHRH